MNENEELYWKMQEKKFHYLSQLQTANASQNAADYFEFCCDKHGDAPCVRSVEDDTSYTFRELDEAANRVANWGKSAEVGLQTGDTVSVLWFNCVFNNVPLCKKVALLMNNRPEYLFITMGLAKIGVTIALLNTNVRSNFLKHAVAISDAKLVIVSKTKKHTWQSFETALASDHKWKRKLDVWWFSNVTNCDDFSNMHPKRYLTDHDFSTSYLSSFSTDRLDKSLRSNIKERDSLYYLFTSGTTGASKAAKFSHRRFIGAGITWAEPSTLKAGERFYVTLPLHHGNGGVLAASTGYFLGTEMILREKFSASNFFNDIRKFNCAATVYIGELWRYLYLQPPTPLDGTPNFSPLRVIIGNGLRADIWESVTTRFHIKHVVEHYASIEMPGDAILNYFNKVGACGFIPPTEALKKSTTGEGGVIVKYDIEADTLIRNETGSCIACGVEEVGELIMRLPDGKYDGYVGEDATRKKLHLNVFGEGDTWWSSGDLLKTNSEGFFYFVDRAGDSYRWKGENVSTNEVSQVIASFMGVAEANVYGVQIPNTDGRAGMACVVLDSPSVVTLVEIPTDNIPTLSNTELPIVFDFNRFTRHMDKNLPTYARPIFIRFRRTENDKTATLKFQKFKYVQDSFDPDKCGGDLVWFNRSKVDHLNQDADVPAGTRMAGWLPVDKKVIEDIKKGLYKF
ncbi:hypothetical protein HK098_000774 [Nowakowskiella sp. JEL0407]|nr:hypothetical protein HK098_000774 [Nowakowskiella sp. JEL0407]